MWFVFVVSPDCLLDLTWVSEFQLQSNSKRKSHVNEWPLKWVSSFHTQTNQDRDSSHRKAMKNSWKLSRLGSWCTGWAGCRCHSSSSRDKIEILSEKALRSELVMLGNRPRFLIRKLYIWKTTKRFVVCKTIVQIKKLCKYLKSEIFGTVANPGKKQQQHVEQTCQCCQSRSFGTF